MDLIVYEYSDNKYFIRNNHLFTISRFSIDGEKVVDGKRIIEISGEVYGKSDLNKFKGQCVSVKSDNGYDEDDEGINIKRCHYITKESGKWGGSIFVFSVDMTDEKESDNVEYKIDMLLNKLNEVTDKIKELSETTDAIYSHLGCSKSRNSDW